MQSAKNKILVLGLFRTMCSCFKQISCSLMPDVLCQFLIEMWENTRKSNFHWVNILSSITLASSIICKSRISSRRRGCCFRHISKASGCNLAGVRFTCSPLSSLVVHSTHRVVESRPALWDKAAANLANWGLRSWWKWKKKKKNTLVCAFCKPKVAPATHTWSLALITLQTNYFLSKKCFQILRN